MRTLAAAIVTVVALQFAVPVTSAAASPVGEPELLGPVGGIDEDNPFPAISVSADGNVVAFLEPGPNNYSSPRLVVVDRTTGKRVTPQGGDPRDNSFHPKKIDHYSAAFALDPSGNRLVASASSLIHGLVILNWREERLLETAVWRVPFTSGGRAREVAASYGAHRVAYIARETEQYGSNKVFVLGRGELPNQLLRSSGDSEGLSISADGRYVAYTTYVGEEAKGGQQWGAFVVDTLTGKATRIGGPVPGRYPGRGAWVQQISADGNYVVFTTDGQLLPEDVTGHPSDPDGEDFSSDVYGYDLRTGKLELISVSTDGRTDWEGVWRASVSASGRYVAFITLERLSPEDTDEDADIYLRDRQRGTTTLLTANVEGEPTALALSADGTTLIFDQIDKSADTHNLYAMELNVPADVIDWTAVRPRFDDTDGSVFEDDIEWLAEAGITMGCNPPANTRFCPDEPVTRGQMAAFLSRSFHLREKEWEFTDTRGSVFAEDASLMVTPLG